MLQDEQMHKMTSISLKLAEIVISSEDKGKCTQEGIFFAL
jgi:hypothetical protein